MGPSKYTVELRATDGELAFRWSGMAIGSDDAVEAATFDWGLAFAAARLASGRCAEAAPAELAARECVRNDAASPLSNRVTTWAIGTAAQHLFSWDGDPRGPDDIGNDAAREIAQALLATDDALFGRAVSEGLWLNAALLQREAGTAMDTIVGLSGNASRTKTCSRETARALMAITTWRLSRIGGHADRRSLTMSAQYDAPPSATLAATQARRYAAQAPAPLRRAASLLSQMGADDLGLALTRRALKAECGH